MLSVGRSLYFPHDPSEDQDPPLVHFISPAGTQQANQLGGVHCALCSVCAAGEFFFFDNPPKENGRH